MNSDLPRMQLGRIIKNAALGSALIGEAAYSYYKATEYVNGIDLFRSILVLPMLFHTPTVKAIHRMEFKSGLIKAVLENKIILNGLDERVTDTLETTFRSIQIGKDSRLYRFDKFDDGFQLTPLRPKFPTLVKNQPEKIRHMFAAAQRLGVWFHHDLASLYKMLQIRLDT
jgi:hypothetical protein